MYKNFIPCVYFPTTVVLVDDESSFLESIESGLGKKIALQTFQTVESAASFLKNSGSPQILVDSWKLYPRTSPYFDDHVREFDVDVQKICDVMYNADRFRQVAVVVVDYAMPGLNGLEFCRTIQDSPFKKILLTGEADEKIAVDAFNEGLIHRFIRKDEPGYLDNYAQSFLI